MRPSTAFVRASLVDRVLHALEACEHFPGVSISTCEGESRGRGVDCAHETETGLSLRRMNRLELYYANEQVDVLVDAIQRSAHTGHHGDGPIGVQDVLGVVRVHGGARDDAAQ